MNQVAARYGRARPAGRDLRIESAIDIALVCAVLFAILFNVWIGPLTPLILTGVTAAYCVIRRDRLPALLLDTWPLLLLPALAIASVLWSINGGESMKAGLLYLLTVLVALILGSGVRRIDLLKAVFFSFLIFTLLSWIYGYSQIGQRAFQGLLASKNAMGELSGGLVLAAICLFSDAVSRRKWLLGITCLLGLALGAVSLGLAEATTATIATGTASLCAIVWLTTLRLDAQSRTFLFLFAIIFSAIVFGIFYSFQDIIFDYVLGASGKDTTLTGRTDIWRVADGLIAERPWLGIGYNTFWHPGNLEAEALWRQFGIGNRSGFNFHNTYREITVHLGYVGFALFLAVSVIGTLGLFLGTMRKPSIPLVFLSALMISSAIKLPFESFGFGAMQLFGILTFAAISAGYTTFKLRSS